MNKEEPHKGESPMPVYYPDDAEDTQTRPSSTIVRRRSAITNDYSTPRNVVHPRGTTQKGSTQMARPTHVHDPETRYDRRVDTSIVREPHTESLQRPSWWPRLMWFGWSTFALAVLFWLFLWTPIEHQWHGGDGHVRRYTDRIFLDGSSVDVDAGVLNSAIVVVVQRSDGTGQTFTWSFSTKSDDHDVEVIDARDSHGQAEWQVTVDGLEGPVIKKDGKTYVIVAK